MTRCATVLLLLVLITSSASSFPASGEASAAFERLKQLAGEWEGKTPDGTFVQVSYELVSSGTVLMERLGSSDEPSMISVYHIDGDSLIMTHYCSEGNQPRMRAALPGEANRIKFNFFDGTNLGKSSHGHMQSLVVTFEDKDHMRQEWTSRHGGKEATAVFNFARKK